MTGQLINNTAVGLATLDGLSNLTWAGTLVATASPPVGHMEGEFSNTSASPPVNDNDDITSTLNNTDYVYDYVTAFSVDWIDDGTSGCGP